jgi:putative ABC transport system substrate-binding protein
MNATKTVPIVIIGSGTDPVSAGYVESLARPGGNVTGVTNLGRELGGKRLELLKEAVPKLTRVAFPYDPANPDSVYELKEVLPSSARTLGLTIQPWEVRGTDDFDRVFAAINKQRPEGLYVLGGGVVMRPSQKRLADFALKSRLPSVCSSRETVDAGVLMYYGADLADSYRRVAYFVDKILKGAKPADLPVEQPTKFELVINLKTAKQILNADAVRDRKPARSLSDVVRKKFVQLINCVPKMAPPRNLRVPLATGGTYLRTATREGKKVDR